MPTEQNDLKVEWVDIATLKPFVDNPKIHDDRNVDETAKSLVRFKWAKPILVRKKDNMIIDGHGRVQAAMQNGENRAPVIYLDWSENDAKLFTIVDSRTQELSQWDTSKLDSLIEDLQFDMPEFDITDAGFSQDEMDALLEDMQLPDDSNGQSMSGSTTQATCPKCGHQFEV